MTNGPGGKWPLPKPAHAPDSPTPALAVVVPVMHKLVMVRFGRNFRGHRCPAEEVRFFWQN